MDKMIDNEKYPYKKESQTLWASITFHVLWIMIVLYCKTHKQFHNLELTGIPSYLANRDKKHCISIWKINGANKYVDEPVFAYSFKEAIQKMKFSYRS
jgi:hypothetical protein